MTPKEYTDSSKHLPPFMRDFRDQKYLFHHIHCLYSGNESAEEMPRWRDAMCYTIDWFLWFMAQRGYTLQRSRANVEFYDLHEEMEVEGKKRTEAFNAALKAGMAKEKPQ